MHFASYYRWKVISDYLNLPISFKQPILDIGAGDGQFLARIHAKYKVGLDLQFPYQIDFDWVIANGSKLPFSDQCFGHIFAFDVIEHVVDDRDLLHEVFRLLLPGGTLWLSTTSAEFSIFPGGGIQRRFERAWGHVRRGYTKDMILSRLPDEEFEVTFWSWNEPFFRLLYFPLYLMRHIYAPLAEKIAGWLFHVDKNVSEGNKGHIFAKVVRSPQISPG